MTYVCSSVFVSPLMCGMRRAAAYLLGGAVTLVLLIILILKCGAMQNPCLNPTADQTYEVIGEGP